MVKIEDKIKLDIIKLYNTTKYNQKEIAAALNISDWTVRKTLKEAGIKYYSKDRNNKLKEPAAADAVEEASVEATIKPFKPAIPTLIHMFTEEEEGIIKDFNRLILELNKLSKEDIIKIIKEDRTILEKANILELLTTEEEGY